MAAQRPEYERPRTPQILPPAAASFKVEEGPERGNVGAPRSWEQPRADLSPATPRNQVLPAPSEQEMGCPLGLPERGPALWAPPFQPSETHVSLLTSRTVRS